MYLLTLKSEIMQLSRKSFLKAAGVSVLGSSVLGNVGPLSKWADAKASSQADKLGLASYSLRNFNLDKVIEIMQKLGLKYVALEHAFTP